MSLQNALHAMKAWANEAGIDAEGRDLSPFVTAGVLIALADQPADEAEWRVISQIKEALTGQEFSWEEFEGEVNWINENGVESAIETIGENITDYGERELLVKFAALTGVTEGGLNADEGTMLQNIGQGLGFSHQEVLVLLGKAMNAASHGQF